MDTASACRVLCRRFGYLYPTRCTHHRPVISQNRRFSTSKHSKGYLKDNFSGGYTESFLKRLGHRGFTVNSKENLENAAVRLYISCAEYSDFHLFKERFGMKDTFAEWVNILHLHTWMLTTRFVNPNTQRVEIDLKFLNERTHYHMWTDINVRAKKLAKGSLRRKGIKQLSDHYLGLVLVYDESYHSNDKSLAGALWKTLLDEREDVEPQQLLQLVDYVHRNMNHLEAISDELLMNGIISFLPLDSDKPDIKKDKHVQRILSALP